MCYTFTMQTDRSFWPAWAQFLNRWGMAESAAFLFEAAGPVTVLIAQLLYAGKPFLPSGAVVPALVHLFEDRTESQQFAAYLREEHTW